jgi:chromate transporter
MTREPPAERADDVSVHRPASAAPALPTDGAAAPAPPRFREALAFWLLLGFISFGGPAGQIAILHAELVERRRWISEQRFLHALNYCMLLPGPEAQQLATYLGWLLHRTAGGVVAGVLFVLPSLLLLILLSWVYLRFGQLPVVAGLFYGLKSAVAALVLHAAWRVGTRALRHPALWWLAAAAFVAIAVLDLPFPAIVAAAALLGAAGARWRPSLFAPPSAPGGAAAAPHPPAVIDDDTPPPPHARHDRGRLLRVLGIGLVLWLLPMAALFASFGLQGTLTQMGWFFTKAALLTFGGAYAVLPYVHQGAVEHFQWLTTAQMIDGLALGETTPGPLIMVVAFVAFLGGWQHQVFGPDGQLAAGVAGALVATWFTFLPSFLFILAGGPLVEGTRGRLGFTAPLTGITAAVVGVIASLALVVGTHVVWPQGFGQPPDLAAAALAVAAAVALFRWRIGVLPLLAACAVAGLGWTLLRG